MKKSILISTVLLITLLACKTQSEQSKKEVDEPKTEQNIESALTVEYKVEGMTCDGCENAICSNINKLDGILEVSADHEAGNTIVRFDTTKISSYEIENAITETGYTLVK